MKPSEEQMMDSVEEVFAGSDLKLMANTLAKMRRGLKVLDRFLTVLNRGRSVCVIACEKMNIDERIRERVESSLY